MVPHYFSYGSVGVPAVPATISMSAGTHITFEHSISIGSLEQILHWNTKTQLTWEHWNKAYIETLEHSILWNTGTQLTFEH